MKKISLLKKPIQKPQSINHKLDLLFLISIILLSLFGLLMVYDASQFEAFQSFNDKYYFARQQSYSFVVGIIALTFFSFFNYHNLKKISNIFLFFSLFLLLLVFIPNLGISAYGAHRWLRLGFFTLQPAEIIKMAAIIFLANLFSKQFKLMPFLLLVAVVGIIVGLLQKDLGSAVVFEVIAFGIYFVAGAPIKHLLAVISAGLVAVVGLILIAPYRIKRILAFLDPFSDSQGYSYHITQVLIAIGSGGLTGLGIGQSRQKYSFIPEVTTDSIFSIIGEEFGFIGSVIVIMLFGILIYRGFKIAQKSPDIFGKLLASGLTIWIGIQTVVNLSAMVSLMPLTGVPLPFISFGGSALLVNLIAAGILLNISKQTIEQ
ncbi:MAG: putative lipid II flippase FtsW [Candidatus Daviesbacteria bacterium]|nr:putative lipid II flippase FtsW [Candidatus Daviesbacteria bacterium]